MLQLDSLTFGYPQQKPLFQDFSLEIKRGETWAILGTSGCGKTTLLYLIAGLILPVSGQIQVDGELLTRPRPHTGLILQDYGLLPWATVRENAELGLRVRGFYGPDGTHAPLAPAPVESADSWLERLGIAEIAGKYPAQISGGQRQRTAIARTLTIQPDLLLMDEPFSSLDAPTREDLQTLTLDLCREQDLTLVMVTHAIEEAVTIGQKILLLGAPPNTSPVIFDNPQSRQPGFRHSPEYQHMCQFLRAAMVKA
jgi:NitT/TauT family transport system ATP-binding protein